MALNEDKLGNAELASGSQTTIYTVPASTRSTVLIMWFCNTTAADRTVELWHVDSAGSPTDANKLLFDFTVPANDFMQVTTKISGVAGDTIQGEADLAGSVTVSLFGYERDV